MVNAQFVVCYFTWESIINKLFFQYLPIDRFSRLLMFVGHVRIESLRLREDVFIAAAFLNPYSTFWNSSDGDVINPDGSGCSCCYNGLKAALGEDILQAVLQRVKVLAAHEVIHYIYSLVVVLYYFVSELHLVTSLLVVIF
jgi:hypothetical protein